MRAYNIYLPRSAVCLPRFGLSITMDIQRSGRRGAGACVRARRPERESGAAVHQSTPRCLPVIYDRSALSFNRSPAARCLLSRITRPVSPSYHRIICVTGTGWSQSGTAESRPVNGVHASSYCGLTTPDTRAVYVRRTHIGRGELRMSACVSE